MPQMGLEVTEGIVATIHVARGTRVAEGDLLLELETDKALTDVVAPRGGLVQSIEVEVGDTVELGATLVVLADEEGGGGGPARGAASRRRAGGLLTRARAAAAAR